MTGNITEYRDLVKQMKSSDKSFQALGHEFGKLNIDMLAEEIKKTDPMSFAKKNTRPNFSTVDLDFFLDNPEDYRGMTEELNFNHYYLTLLYIYFDVKKAMDWLKELNTNRERGISALISIEFPHSSYSKIFLKGKNLKDLVTATIVTKDFSSFFKELDDFTKDGVYQYWTETGKRILGHDTLTCYLYNSKKTYKNKILPVEIVLKTPRQFCLENALKHQLSPEEAIKTQKMEEYVNGLNIYERRNLKHAEREEYIDKLMDGDYILETDWKEFNHFITLPKEVKEVDLGSKKRGFFGCF